MGNNGQFIRCPYSSYTISKEVCEARQTEVYFDCGECSRWSEKTAEANMWRFHHPYLPPNELLYRKLLRKDVRKLGKTKADVLYDWMVRQRLTKKQVLQRKR